VLYIIVFDWTGLDLHMTIANVVEKKLSGLRKGRVTRVDVVVAVVVCHIFEQARAAIGVEYLVAFECGASTNVLLTQWITGIPYRNVFLPVQRSNEISLIHLKKITGKLCGNFAANSL
jgi:hypothetical protein